MKTGHLLNKSIVHGLWSKVFPSRRRAAGFTLLEMLVVVAILLLLAGLILAGVNAARNRAKVLRARRDVAQLRSALETYNTDYSGFPDITEADSIFGNYYVTGQALVQTLRGRENFNGHNPRKIPYMDFHQNTTTFNDPWGNQYRVSMDTDYDGEVDVPPSGSTLRQSVAAWSAGPDGDDDDTDDNVKTWRE